MNSTFDELLALLDIPHTKGTLWYKDKKSKVEQLLERKQSLQPKELCLSCHTKEVAVKGELYCNACFAKKINQFSK